MIRIYGMERADGRAAAHELLRLAAAEMWGLEELPDVEYGPKGKPRFACRPDLHFNLSHSGGYALCALGDRPVGADIEEIRPRRALRALAERAFSAGELAWFEARGGGLEEFYTLWTRKEALVKYTGEGIAALRLRIPPLPGEESGSPRLRSWAGENWRAALCGEGELPEEIIWK